MKINDITIDLPIEEQLDLLNTELVQIRKQMDVLSHSLYVYTKRRDRLYEKFDLSHGTLPLDCMFKFTDENPLSVPISTLTYYVVDNEHNRNLKPLFDEIVDKASTINFEYEVVSARRWRLVREREQLDVTQQK